jgi:hypothetical protein
VLCCSISGLADRHTNKGCAGCSAFTAKPFMTLVHALIEVGVMRSQVSISGLLRMLRLRIVVDGRGFELTRRFDDADPSAGQDELECDLKYKEQKDLAIIQWNPPPGYRIEEVWVPGEPSDLRV